MRIARAVVLGAWTFIALSAPAEAQTAGQVTGLVTNPQGQALAGVSVTLSGGAAAPAAVLTSDTGRFELAQVAIGVYTLTVRLAGFRDLVRTRVVVRAAKTATLDLQLVPLGALPEATADAGPTTIGATIDRPVMDHVPTARDPWQIMALTSGVTLSGVNVAGSASGQQLTPSAFGSSADVQWHVDGGTITDMSSNTSPAYYNFDSLEAVQVITAGSDVSVASAGIFINLITRSGTNRLAGSALTTYASSALQSQNVSETAFASGTTAAGVGLSGNPLRHIDVSSGEMGGPILRNRFWYWAGLDYQDIDVTDANFFDTTRPGCTPPPATYAQLSAIQACLADDTTTVENLNGKLTARVGASTNLQLLYQTNQKVRNNRATAQTDVSSTQTQYDGGAFVADPLVQATHTWTPTRAFAMVNEVTHAQNGFFLDSHDYTRCGSSTYARDQAGLDPTDPTCGWNVQGLTNVTTGLTTRGPSTPAFQTSRPSWEARTDDHYFAHLLGGDHTLRFGAGWRKDPVLSYSHQGGGAVAMVQCVNNLLTDCGASTEVPVGSGSGLVPYEAVLYRDGLTNYDWRTVNWYAQDAYSLRRLTVTGGARWDWQSSTYLGGCVSANVIIPQVFPEQCQGPVNPDQPFHALSPRASAVYDLSGDGRTIVRGSLAYYHQSELLLANAYSDLGAVHVTYGPNMPSGACPPAFAGSCWRDANQDGIVQASELLGPGTFSSSAFVNGTLTLPAPVVDPDLEPGRTREGTVGLSRAFGRTLETAVDFLYRYNDLGSAAYGASVADVTSAASQWQEHLYTDANTGITAPYYTVCASCEAPLGGRSETTTSLAHDTDVAVTTSVTKRLADHWQGVLSYTWNDERVFTPVGSYATTGFLANPTGVAFTNGFTNGTPPHDLQAFGYVELPHGLSAGLHLSVRSGNLRTLTINGPGTVQNGYDEVISYPTLTFQNTGSTRTPVTAILDLNLARTFGLGRTTLTLTVDCFNVLNAATPQSYASNDVSDNGLNGLPPSFTEIAALVPPRVFRLDARFRF